MSMLGAVAQKMPCPSCGEAISSSKKGPCTKCQIKEGLAASALAVEKRKEQDARGTFGDAASKWRTIHAASKVIADVRAECGVPRSDPR